MNAGQHRPAGSPAGSGRAPTGAADTADGLPIAIRAHTVTTPAPAGKAAGGRAPRKRTRPGRRPGDGPAPAALLVFDTETTIDAAQALLFGCWRYYQRRDEHWVCVQEGLFHGDDLAERDPAGLAVLRRVTESSRAHTDDGNTTPLQLLSRAQFVEKVLFAAGWQGRARIVGFNLPFDLSRLAIAASEGRGRNRGGFSLTLAAGNREKGYTERRHRPRVQIKHVNAFRAQISFADALGATEGWRGDFVDLRTFAHALTGRGHSLDSACQAFGVPGKTDPGQHGQITGSYVAYCRQDVAATAALYQACETELGALAVPLTPPYAYSPASLAKATLTGLGVRPILQRHPDTDPALLGVAMSAFYGGRAECRIRRTPLPVRLVDFTSTYPTLFALMNLWTYVTAEKITTRQGPEVTSRVQQQLDTFTLAGGFNPALWPGLVGYGKIRPGGEVLPVRAQYDPHTPSFGIGVNPLHAEEELWYALPDLFAAKLLTGTPAHLLEVILFDPAGQTDGLTPFTLPGGRRVDPRTVDPFTAMTEERQRVRADPALSAEQRDRIQLFLKITSNAGAYGIWAEYNPTELPAGVQRTVTVYSNTPEPFTHTVSAPEEPGKFCYPPLAAVLTAGARLLLALLERCVTDAGGSWAMADTDSMGIVATETGGLIPCPGGPHQAGGHAAVRALSYQQVETIRNRFTALNPYDPAAVPGSILKAEVDALCYAIAAKRYALFRYDPAGRPRLVAATEHAPCSHGLGHLLNPVDPDQDPDAQRWIVALWEYELARTLTPDLAGPPLHWYDRPALARIAATSPQLL